MCGFFFHTGFQIEKIPKVQCYSALPGKKFTADDRT